MSQLILDDQLDVVDVLSGLVKWITARRLREFRPHERVLDDRVPEILLTLNRPTFVTIDKGFWRPNLCNPGYCILCFDIDDNDQRLLPGMLRALFRLPEFRTRANRMGKVARIRPRSVEYCQFPFHEIQRIRWATMR